MSAEEWVVESAQARVRTPEPLDMHIGQVLLRAGKLTENDIKRVVTIQSTREVRFGDAAMSLGMVDRRDIQQALSLQFSYPYLRTGESPLSAELIVAYQPFSAQAEAMRKLRSQLSMRWFGKHKALAIVSAREREGASAIASNLAIAFAQAGERTLLIDANFRTPRQHQIFGLATEIGLSTILADRCCFEEALSPIGTFDKLSVLGAGPIPPNPQELLERRSFSSLIETAPEGFDVVLVDTPALLDYADAQTVVARTRGCMLAMRRHSTRVDDVEQARSLLAPAAAMLVGTVLCS
jgi:protein-tyrosine kinase